MFSQTTCMGGYAKASPLEEVYEDAYSRKAKKKKKTS